MTIEEIRKNAPDGATHYYMRGHHTILLLKSKKIWKIFDKGEFVRFKPNLIDLLYNIKPIRELNDAKPL